MNKKLTVAVLSALAVGLGGGAIGAYSWLHASGDSGRPAGREDHDAGESSHEDHHEHGEDGHGGHDDPISLSKKVMDEFGVEVSVAGPGDLEFDLSLPGEVVVNPDQVVHVVPRLPGIVEKVNKTVGDAVKGGEVLAVIESAQLANTKATYLGAKQRLSVAQASTAANKELKAEGIVSELEFLGVQRELAEAEIQLRAAEFKLYTLGLTKDDLPKIEGQNGASFARSEVLSPLSARIVDRHISLGEVVTPESEIFVLADLSTVWVHLTVYQKDLAHVRPGQAAVISFGHDIPDAQGVIDYISPTVEEKTRTATARVVLKNPKGFWRPGLFVEAHVQTSKEQVPIRVSARALVAIHDETVVFVESEGGFRPRRVTAGQSDGTHTEITSGLIAGDRYVSEGAFNLKAELLKESFAGGGHAH